jgi:uncharacterized delta-60 repeat protein
MHTRRVRVASRLALAAILAAGAAAAEPGDLDPSFGRGGKLRTSLSRGSDSATRIAVQDDGKIVTVGTGDRGDERDLLLARFLPDGALDRAFGDRGRVFFGFKRKTERGASIALQEDGCIVVAAQVEKGDNTARMLLTRFTSDGRYDPSFGQEGRVTTAFDDLYLSPRAVLVTTSGAIVVGGEGFVGGLEGSGERVWILARYRSNGRLDRDFGNNGRVVLPLGNGLEALAEQPDGKIVAGGAVGPGQVDFAVARLLADGSLDASFGDAGVARTSFGAQNDYVHAVAVDALGRIVAAGRTWSTFSPNVALARYLPNGAPDPEFGIDGKLTTDVGGRTDEGYGLLLAEGRIVVAGWATIRRQAQFAVIRYLEDGSLDPEFGEGGIVTTPLGRQSALATDVALQGADRLIVGGFAMNPKNASDVALVGYVC